MNCEQCDRYLLDLAEGDVPVPAEVRAHVESCGECSQKVENLRAGLQLADRLELEEPPAELDAPILAAARKQAETRRGGGGGWGVPQFAAAAVALLAVGVGFWATENPWASTAHDAQPTATASGQGAEAVTDEAAKPRPDRAEPEPEADEPAPFGVLAGRELSEQESTAGDVMARGASDLPGEAAAPARKVTARKRSARKADGLDAITLGKAPAPAAANKKAKAAADDGYSGGGAGRSFDAAEEVAGMATGSKGARAESGVAQERIRATRARPAPSAESKRDSSDRAQAEKRNADSAYRKRCKETVPEYERFLEKKPAEAKGVPEVELELGRCYRALGKDSKAKVLLRQAASHRGTRDAALRELDMIEAESAE